MQYENKILISAILIIGLALVSFNVINTNDISGSVSKKSCDSPSLVAKRMGSTIFVTVSQPFDQDLPGTRYSGIYRNDPYVYGADSSKNRMGRTPIGRDNLDAAEFTVKFKDLNTEFVYVYVRGCDGEKVFAPVPPPAY